MAFIQCSKEQADRFAEFLTASSFWMSTAIQGEYEAWRLVKVNKPTEASVAYCKLDTCVIHVNKRGIHSFDPLFHNAFEASKKYGVDEVRRMTTVLVDERLVDDDSYVERAVLFNKLRYPVTKKHEAPYMERHRNIRDQKWPPGQLFYIQDGRQIVGNCIYWWVENSQGYTCNLKRAWKVDYATAAEIEGSRQTEILWPVEEVDAVAQVHVDIQNLRPLQKRAEKAAAYPNLQDDL